MLIPDENFIQALPKAEMHLHLEGAASWALAQQYSPEALPESPAWWKADFRFPDFVDFGRSMSPAITHVLTSAERYGEVAALIFRDLVAQNARYVEISFGANIPYPMIPLDDIVAAIRATAPPHLIVKIIAGFNRTHPIAPELADLVLNLPGIDGIDLHSDERRVSPDPFAPFTMPPAKKACS